MSLLGSVQRKLQALQKIWQEDARRNNGQKKKKIITEASYPALATIYIFEITANKMEIPLKWNKLFSEIPIWLLLVMSEIKHVKLHSIYFMEFNWRLTCYWKSVCLYNFPVRNQGTWIPLKLLLLALWSLFLLIHVTKQISLYLIDVWRLLEQLLTSKEMPVEEFYSHTFKCHWKSA